MSGTVEIRQNGSRVTSAAPLSWEVHGNSEKPLLHLWSENCNVTRRVVAITDNSQDRLALAVERFGRVKPERMEIVRLEYTPGPRDLAREGYCEQLRRILAERFPDETLEKNLRCPGSGTLSCGFADLPSPAGTKTKSSLEAISPGRNFVRRMNRR